MVSEEDVGVSTGTSFAALGLGAVVLQFTKLLPQTALTVALGWSPRTLFTNSVSDSDVNGPGAIL